MLRGLLYQLSGDAALVAMRVISLSKGNADFEVLADKADIATVRDSAAALLKRYRDAGAGAMPLGPRERLAQSLRLTAGFEMTEPELGLWVETLGMGGLNAAVLFKQAGVPFVAGRSTDPAIFVGVPLREGVPVEVARHAAKSIDKGYLATTRPQRGSPVL